MSDAGWRIARLREIPFSSELPGFSQRGYQQAMAERAEHPPALGRRGGAVRPGEPQDTRRRPVLLYADG